MLQGSCWYPLAPTALRAFENLTHAQQVVPSVRKEVDKGGSSVKSFYYSFHKRERVDGPPPVLASFSNVPFIPRIPSLFSYPCFKPSFLSTVHSSSTMILAHWHILAPHLP